VISILITIQAFVRQSRVWKSEAGPAQVPLILGRFGLLLRRLRSPAAMLKAQPPALSRLALLVRRDNKV